ncbi:MAG: btrG [Mucilaginibacter sp.]|nr:btrG [Mucilaginibacter sp.]
MKETPSWLFVYGTLLDKQNEFGAYLNAKCSFYAEGRFKGRLYDIGEYPGAVSDADGSCYVYGKIFAVNDPDNVLKQLDYYEGFGADQAKPNLFIRERMSIETDNEPVICWVYLYNLSVEGLWLIKSGKYLS